MCIQIKQLHLGKTKHIQKNSVHIVSQAVTPKLTRGFTLVELIVVIIILGILAATALPKMLDLGKDARIAAVKSLEGSIKSALNMIYAKCSASSTCDVNTPYYPVAPTPISTVVLDGVTHRLQYGYPWSDRTGLGGGLPALLNISGFTDQYPTIPTGTTLTKDGAPDPTYCYVKYLKAPTVGSYPIITTDTTGC